VVSAERVVRRYGRLAASGQRVRPKGVVRLRGRLRLKTQRRLAVRGRISRVAVGRVVERERGIELLVGRRGGTG
jgi:hypothetical protein